MTSPLREAHVVVVAAWEERVGHDSPSDVQLEAFEEAFRALWGRAHQTLGEVTLVAIVDRVLYTAAERHPVLSSLSVGSAGLSCQALRGRADSLPPGELTLPIRFVLVELLRVLGALTADILTPALHAALSSAGAPQNREKTP
jgi:hypothetical protein